ncbi:hypothetical protein L195_g018570 [Trifolium pratense]|uniref:Uncharacterized protein n=1 Tax=Trifolium pratense TaxID=57577 RepID=A0A2K3MXA6_TRIPR|nr:hypothetical protein L195_g018570 [Trifolium pratense]
MASEGAFGRRISLEEWVTSFPSTTQVSLWWNDLLQNWSGCRNGLDSKNLEMEDGALAFGTIFG